MKMKVADVIRKSSDEVIAKIIGAVVLQYTEGISAEEAIKLDYSSTLKELQKEIEIDCKQTNFDICCKSIENMAQIIDIAKCGWTKEEVIEWMQSEVKG